MKKCLSIMTRSHNTVIFSCTILLTLLVSSCNTPGRGLGNQVHYSRDDSRYKDRYTIAFDHHEKPLRFWYHYVVSKTPEGYKVRVFNPDTKVLIEEKTYGSAALTVMEGPYKSYWDDGSIRTQGAYTNGQRCGSWLECEPGKGKSSSGPYVNDDKDGVWTHVDTSGLVEYVYVWQHGHRDGEYYEFDTLGRQSNEGMYSADTLISVDHPQMQARMPYLKSCQSSSGSEIPGCTEAKLTQLIMAHLRYPQAAREMEIEGVAVMEWDIMPDGSVSHLRVPRSLSSDIEQACLQALPEMPEWIPARKNGRPVKWTMSIPVRFTL